MKSKKRLYFLLRLLFAIMVSFWVWKRIQSADITSDQLFKIPIWIYVVPSFVIAVNTLVHSFRLWLLFVAIEHPVPFAGILSSVLKGHFAGLALPMGGGDLVKIGYLAAEGGGLSKATAMLGVARILELIPWGLALVFGALWLWPKSTLFGVLSLGFGMSLLGVAAGGFGATRLNIDMQRLGPERIGQFVRSLAQGVQLLSGKKEVLWKVGLLGGIFLVMNTVCVWILCQGYGAPLFMIDVLTVFPLVDLLVSLPISINGVGVRELVYPEVLSIYQLPMGTALAIAWTRWTGELARGMFGGIVFLRDRRSS